MKLDASIYFQTITSAVDFHRWIEANETELGFSHKEFHDNMLGEMFDGGNSSLSSRYDPQWCQQVVDKDELTKGKEYDKTRKYYPAFLLFMKDYEMKSVRFILDW